MPLLKLKTAAIDEPVSLDEFMTHARIDDNGDQSDIAGKLLAARMHVEDLTARALVTQTWLMYLNQWPQSEYRCQSVEIPLPLGNLQRVNSIKYTDTTGTHTLDPSTYEVDLPGNRIVLADGQSWPSSTLKKASPICVEFDCGWPTAADVPQPLKAAIMLLAAHWFRNREAVTIGRSTVESMPLKMAVDALIAPYAIWRL